jgi:hypothetical protein
MTMNYYAVPNDCVGLKPDKHSEFTSPRYKAVEEFAEINELVVVDDEGDRV